MTIEAKISEMNIPELLKGKLDRLGLETAGQVARTIDYFTRQGNCDPRVMQELTDNDLAQIRSALDELVVQAKAKKEAKPGPSPASKPKPAAKPKNAGKAAAKPPAAKQPTTSITNRQSYWEGTSMKSSALHPPVRVPLGEIACRLAPVPIGLASLVQAYGPLAPLVLTPIQNMELGGRIAGEAMGAKKYWVVLGDEWYLAARDAGLMSVPAVIVHVTVAQEQQVRSQWAEMSRVLMLSWARQECAKMRERAASLESWLEVA